MKSRGLDVGKKSGSDAISRRSGDGTDCTKVESDVMNVTFPYNQTNTHQDKPQDRYDVPRALAEWHLASGRHSQTSSVPRQAV